MYRIVYRKEVVKVLTKLPNKLARQFMDAFERIAKGQDEELDIKKLEGRDGLRLRIGSYRAIYRKLNDVMIIDVLKLSSRGDVYK